MTSLEKNTETKLTLDVKEAGGKTNGTVDLPAEIFDAPANIALLHYSDGTKAYILAPARLKVGMMLREMPSASTTGPTMVLSAS